MKKTTPAVFALCTMIALLALPSSPLFAAAESAAAWQADARPRRILLDWRPTDRQNVAEPTELFVDCAKLAAATGLDHLTPASVALVAESADGTTQSLPFASRDEVGQFGRQGTVFRFVPPAPAKRLWIYFGGADQSAQPLPTQWNLLDGALDSMDPWHISDPHVTANVAGPASEKAMHIAYDDGGHPLNPNLRVQITRSFPIPPDCRGVEAKVAFDLKCDCENHVPVTILLHQFNQAGKQLGSCVVDPRWLSTCLASGQEVNFRETGFIYPETTSITLTVGLWCPQNRDRIMNYDGAWLKYPSSDNFTMQITRAEMRAAHPIAFPGFDKSLYAPGLTGNENDLALAIGQGAGFCYDANPRSVWSEGALPSDPRAYYWPCAAGTFECWIFPQWNANDTGSRYILNACAGYGAENSVLKIFYTPATSQFHVVRADLSDNSTQQVAPCSLTPGQWHHIAYTWDPSAGRQQLFVDGASIMDHRGDDIPTIDITNLGSAKQIPGRVWLGQTIPGVSYHDDALHGRLDEVRISDGVRYSAPFTPEHIAFPIDSSTRALFHFDARLDGQSAGPEARIPGTILSPDSPASNTVEYQTRGSTETVNAPWFNPALPDSINPLKLFPVNMYPALTRNEYTQSEIDRQTVLHLKPGESANISCDAQPHMDWVEIRCPDDATTMLARPFLSKPGEIDPRNIKSLLATLGIDKLSSDRQRADAIFKYLVGHNDYFWATIAEIEPSGEITDPGEFATLYLNGYPEFGCGEQNRMTRDCFLAAGLSADMAHGSGHVLEQVFFNSSWHAYDLFPRLFFPARDEQRPAALSEVERDPYLAVRVGRPVVGYWQPSDTRIYQFPDREIALPDMGYRLRPGESLRYYWHSDGRYNPILTNKTEQDSEWTEGPTSHGKPLYWSARFPPDAANGIFSFSCTPRADQLALSDWHDGAFVYRFLSPFVVCGANVTAATSNGTQPTVELSYNQGRSWSPAPAADSAGQIKLDRVCTDRHLYWIRVTPPPRQTITHFEHHAIVMMSPKVLTPVLAKGDNTVGLSADAGSAAQVTVQYHEDNDAPLEIEGGTRFGWLTGYPRQLLVSQPGGSLTFQVKQSDSAPAIAVPAGVQSTVQSAGDGNWQIKLDVPPSFADGLYPLTVTSGQRYRTIAILIAAKARVVPAQQAATQGDARMTPDPEGIRGSVLSLNAGAQAAFPLGDDGAGPLALYALAKIPENPHSVSTISLASGPAPLLQPNFAHAFWTQEQLQYRWKWFHVIAGGYPFQSLAAVNLADPHSATIHCDEGQALINAVLVIPARDERLVEAVTQYLFCADYDPWAFKSDWGPITAGAPYPVK